MEFEAARILSLQREYRGTVGHLVTVADIHENAFVRWLARGAGDVWAGMWLDNGTWKYTDGPEANQTLAFTYWLFGYDQIDVANSVRAAITTGGRHYAALSYSNKPFVIEYECPIGQRFGPAGCVGL